MELFGTIVARLKEEEHHHRKLRSRRRWNSLE
jgi:hypothetical protein